MLIIHNDSLDPYFNAALEEYLFKNLNEDIFMLWRNRKAVVLGKHQNAIREVNIDYVESAHIPVVRRLSGGGTVYHDSGNINFTFIMTRESDKVVDFKRYMEPVYMALKELDLDVRFSDRNDLFIGNSKISGNAEHAVKNRVLHHGTLLFSADISSLSSSIKPGNLNIVDKAVQSVRSPVTNILDHLPVKINIEAFMLHLEKRMKLYFNGLKEYRLSPTELEAVMDLKERKYATWDWNYGYSPKYKVIGSFHTDKQHCLIHLEVAKGVVSAVDFENLDGPLATELSTALIGLRHKKSEIKQALDILEKSGIIESSTTIELLEKLV